LLDSVSKDDRFFVEGMLSRTRGLLGLIQDLLTIRRLEEANLPLLPSTFDLVELAQGVVYDMTPLAKEAGFRFEVEGESNTIQGDRQLISRVTENLLSNALKYHRPPKPICVKIYAEKGGVRVDVLDSGKGIPEKHQRLIFERFHQVMNAGATERQGTGLGLTFCRMALEAHQGKIWVESKDGQGTCFSFWLPQNHVEARAVPNSSESRV
jgi:signal transduction histidine kinase